MTFKLAGKEFDFSSKIFVMGVLNITPDSFSDGGKYFSGKPDIKKIVEDAVRMEKDGADFIDVGGESTRPGSESITINEELDRVIPVICELKKNVNLPISIDTYKSEVAEEALKAGACIVNDISGFRFDENLPEVTRRYGASCILMHIKGTPRNMQLNPVYENVVEEVYNYLNDSIGIAKKNDINQIMIDVGIGFGKTFEHNLELIRNLGRFKSLGCPILLGVSRKSFISRIYDSGSSDRLEGTIAANVAGIIYGANVIRVHDVKENVRAARVTEKILKLS